MPRSGNKQTESTNSSGEPVDREIAIDFWKLSNAEIEREMWNRLALLDAGRRLPPRRPDRFPPSDAGQADRFCQKNHSAA